MRQTVFSIMLLLLAALSASADAGAAVGNGADSVAPLVKKEMTLEETIMLARSNSVDAAAALDELRTAYWQYRSYRAELLPELSFRATLPSYHKEYSPYMNEDGNYSFVANNYLQLNGELSLTQNIWLTGGKLSLNSSLDFLRQFGGGAYNRMRTIPVSLTLEQPVFGVNNMKWNRKIEPERFREAKAHFLSATEDVALRAITFYFQLLMSKENHEIALQNLCNSEKLYEVAKEKRAMGRISENDLLQMELNLLEARSALTDNESELRSNMFQLRTFLGIGEDVDLEPVIPEDVPDVEISYSDALQRASANNSHACNLRRRQLEADYAVAKAKGDLRKINLFAQVGYTGTGSDFRSGYSPLKDTQIVEVGFEIPILDWGMRRGKVKVAESNRNVVRSSLLQEEREFNQNLFILVERYGNQQRQLAISKRADEIAARRYDTNVETFLIGKISTLDLNDSRVNKDEARREYVNQLYLFWRYYYEIRSLTLWDYRQSTDITADFSTLF